MITRKFKVSKIESALRVHRYPWWVLEDKNIILEVECPGSRAAQFSAYRYARVQGWKITTQLIGENVIRLSRREEDGIEEIIEPAPTVEKPEEPV